MQNDPKIINLLNNLGLTQTEQKIYLAGLKSSEAGVSELVNSTGINRTTAYHALDTLTQKGFAKESKIQGQLAYRMTAPLELIDNIKFQQNKLDKQIDELQILAPMFPSAGTNAPTTNIEKFETIEGVKAAIEKALYCRSRKWNIIAPRDNFFSQVDPSYAQYFMATRRERGIVARTLWETPAAKQDLSLSDLVMRRPRYLPPTYKGKFKSVIITFDDKALFISSAVNTGAVLIQSQEIIDTLNVMFESLWLSAKTPAESK